MVAITCAKKLTIVALLKVSPIHISKVMRNIAEFNDPLESLKKYNLNTTILIVNARSPIQISNCEDN